MERFEKIGLILLTIGGVALLALAIALNHMPASKSAERWIHADDPNDLVHIKDDWSNVPDGGTDANLDTPE